MLIAGFQKTSLVDYPGRPCAVVFTPCCNMNCGYCHNRELLTGGAPLLDEEQILAFLKKRFGLITAVTISGGEPMLQQNLDVFIGRVRALGYAVKLDTNGLRPDVLLRLIRAELLDYVAMDLKAPLGRYAEIARVKLDTADIQRSITVLRNMGVPHEFRTTFAPQLTREDIVEAALLIEGAERYFLQQYRRRDALDPMPHPPSYVRETAQAVRDAIGVCTLRGLGVEETAGD